MTDLVKTQDAGNALPSRLSGEDRFEITFKLARPTLDALAALWKALAWLSKRRAISAPLFDAAQAADLLKMIPEGAQLIRAQRLFLEAAQDPAVEAWAHIALGVMLSSIPAAADMVSDDYCCGIADSMFRDPYYAPGFSSAVVVGAIREARRQEGVPSPATFLALCVKHRRYFKQWTKDVDELIALRYEAEDHLEEHGSAPIRPEDDPDHPDHVPF